MYENSIDKWLRFRQSVRVCLCSTVTATHNHHHCLLLLLISKA